MIAPTILVLGVNTVLNVTAWRALLRAERNFDARPGVEFFAEEIEFEDGTRGRPVTGAWPVRGAIRHGMARKIDWLLLDLRDPFARYVNSGLGGT